MGSGDVPDGNQTTIQRGINGIEFHEEIYESTNNETADNEKNKKIAENVDTSNEEVENTKTVNPAYISIDDEVDKDCKSNKAIPHYVNIDDQVGEQNKTGYVTVNEAVIEKSDYINQSNGDDHLVTPQLASTSQIYLDLNAMEGN